MKTSKVLTLIAGICATLPLIGQSIYFNDFSSGTITDVTGASTPSNPVVVESSYYDTWYGGGSSTSSIDTSNGYLIASTGGSGQNRGTAIAFDADGSLLSGVVDTTVDSSFYQLSFDILNQFNGNTLQFSLYDGTSDGTATNTYSLDLLSGTNATLTHSPVGTGALDLLASDTYINLDNSSQAIDFEWDGTGELVMVIDFPASATFGQIAQIDNLSITAVPEPGTYALISGVLMLAFVLVRRKRS